MTDPVAPWTHHRPFRNFNPGDLRPRTHPPVWQGQVAIDHSAGGPYAIFSSRPDGWAALGLWLLYAHDVLDLKTTSEKIAKFAPSSENNTSAYAASVAAKVGEDANPHDVPTRTALAKAIAHWEDYEAVWSAAEIVAGMLLTDARWPAFLAAVAPPVAPKLTTDELNALSADGASFPIQETA